MKVELVGGPYCGTWFPLLRLPENREFPVRGFDTPVCIYFLETDECDHEHRASYVRSIGHMTAL